MSTPHGRQPWLHDRQIAVHGNATLLGGPDGEIGAAGTGLLVDDRLVLDRLAWSLDGEPPTVIAATSQGARTSLWASARNLGHDGPDPTVEVHITRTVVAGGALESLTFVSRATQDVAFTARLSVGAAGAELVHVKGGYDRPAPPAVTATADGGEWTDERHATNVAGAPAPARIKVEGSILTMEWDLVLSQGVPAMIEVSIGTERTAPSRFDADPAADRVDWSGIAVTAEDRRLDALVTRGLADLRNLLLADPDAPEDFFAAAGTPWYLTLFGRDSLWTARMMLPVDLELAGGTLRALARRQGNAVDVETAEEPGKILHEVRRTTYVDAGHGMQLPPVYYGSVDATALWVLLLHDAWRTGLPENEIRDLLPNLQAAMTWLQGAADNGTGLLRYVDASGHGLANQGWKDSGDSMRHRDGSIAPAPIALVEAQAYAVEAARGAAEVYDAFGLDGADALRDWATSLTARIRDRYWVSDTDGPYLAMAIDGDGQPVDGVGSNMGHLLGTGVLTGEEAQRTIERLLSPDLLGEFGIGTMGRSNPAYNPIGYHTGSVWTHDSAIILLGMAREGRASDGAPIARGLVDCAAALSYRAPELLAGESVAGAPAPYPASCRPQAWAAASAIAIVTAVLGLDVDVPGRRVRLAPMRPAPFGPLRVTGLRFGRHRFTVEVDGAKVGLSGLPDGVEVDIH